MHRLLEDHPRFKRAAEEAENVRRENARFQAQTAQAEAESRQARLEYEAEWALERDDPVPPRPVSPEVDVALAQQLQAQATDAPRFEREACAELAEEVLPQLERRAGELEETVREAVDSLQTLVREACELRVTAAQLRPASGKSLADQGAVDVVALFDLVVHGHRLLEAESPRPSRVTLSRRTRRLLAARRGTGSPRSLVWRVGGEGRAEPGVGRAAPVAGVAGGSTSLGARRGPGDAAQQAVAGAEGGAGAVDDSLGG